MVTGKATIQLLENGYGLEGAKHSGIRCRLCQHGSLDGTAENKRWDPVLLYILLMFYF